jgi:hypothetical protein
MCHLAAKSNSWANRCNYRCGAIPNIDAEESAYKASLLKKLPEPADLHHDGIQST